MMTDGQQRMFASDPEAYGFLCDLAAAGWQPPAELTPRIEGWLAKLERHGVLRKVGSRIEPLDAAGSPWQAGPTFGGAVTRPLQDQLLAHARDRIRAPGVTECGYARLSLTSRSQERLRTEFRALLAEYAAISRRERGVHPGAVEPVGVLTAAAPLADEPR